MSSGDWPSPVYGCSVVAAGLENRTVPSYSVLRTTVPRGSVSKVLGTCCETSAPSPRILPSHTRGINSVTARRGSRWRENRVWVGFPDGKRRRRSVPTFESDGSRATPDGRASGVPVTRVYIRRPNDLAVSVDTRTEKYSSLSRPWQSPRRRRRRYGSVEREIRPAAGGYGRRSGPSTTRPSAAAPDAVDVDVRSRRPPVDLLRRRLLPPPPGLHLRLGRTPRRSSCRRERS